MLVPFYMLDGEINLIKTVETEQGTEKTYEDEKGNWSVIEVKSKK